MKSGVQGLEQVKKSSLIKQLVAELWHLIKSWRVRALIEKKIIQIAKHNYPVTVLAAV